MIFVDIAKCTGCRMCETACSFYHSGQTSRLKSRIKVINIYETGIDGPVVCQQCKERYCTDCPSNAISVGEFGQIIISHTVCSHCNKCVKSCPIGAIEQHDDIYYVCDLCGGTPNCVAACSESAISYQPELSETISLEDLKERAKGKNVSEKQANFILQAGVELRKKWRKQHA